MKKIIITLIALSIAIGYFIFYRNPDHKNTLLVSAKTSKLLITLPEGYSNNPNDQDDDANVTVSYGVRGKDYRQINIDNDQFNLFFSIADYETRYINSGDIFDRCVSDGAGVNNYCDKVLYSKLIRDEKIKVYQYNLRRVRDVYYPDKDEPERIITTHITFDVLLPSFELITIYPDQSVDSDAVSDAEFIVKNIELVKQH